MSDQPSPKPQSRVSLSLGAAPLLALSENAITPEVLSAAGHSAPEQSPSERVCSEDHSRISPCLGEGFSVLHGIFKADICAKAAHAAAVGATSYETAPAPKSFSTRVHEALSRLGVHGYCEELTWSSEETPETNEFLRGVRWRVLLGALPADHRTWADEIHWQREEYSRLREVFSFTQKTPPQPPLLTETGELKPAKLVNTHDLELFEKIDFTHLKKEIRNDVIRTYMDNPFFKQKEIRDILNSVLYVYARTHSNLGYIQGMNEILAPMVHVLYKDWETTSKALEKEQSNNNNNNSGNNGSCGLTNASTNAEVRAVQAVAQREYIEHDSYRMFLRLMEIIGPLFNSPEASNSSNSSSSSSNNIGYVEIFGRCYEVQRLLAEKDPELAGQLTKLGIQPQLYMLRWVRIMFAQVFPLSDILVFWDAIFALGPPYRLVDHICVTLLLLVRDSIMGHELSDALSVLFHYPEHTAPAALITSLAVNSYFAGWKHSHVFIDSLLPQPHVAMPQFLVARTAHMQSSSSSSNGNGGGGDDYSTTTTTSSSSSSTTKKKKSNKNGGATTTTATTTLSQNGSLGDVDVTGSDRSWQLRTALNRGFGFFKSSNEETEEEALKRKREQQENEAFLQAVRSENKVLEQRAHALEEANKLVLARLDRDIRLLKNCYIFHPECKTSAYEVTTKAALLRKKISELEGIKTLLQSVSGSESESK